MVWKSPQAHAEPGVAGRSDLRRLAAEARQGLFSRRDHGGGDTTCEPCLIYKVVPPKL